MVSQYEKYCVDCASAFHLENDMDYWKNNGWVDDKQARDAIIESDKIPKTGG